MAQLLNFAQKGIVYDPKSKSILLIKYSKAEFVGEKLINKYGLPGGRIEEGQALEESIISKVKWETGVDVKPLNPIDIWSWTYDKNGSPLRIVAVSRVCKYIRGEAKAPIKETGHEVEIGSVVWMPIEEINFEEFVFDEVNSIKLFIENLDLYNFS